MSSPSLLYNRVLIKFSGEALAGDLGQGIDPEVLGRIAAEIQSVQSAGAEVCIVVGGGNFFRGADMATTHISRVVGDHMGMLGTVMNSLAIRAALQHLGVESRVLSAIHINQICEPFIHSRAVRHLEKERVVIFAAGTGNPYFTTDMAAALRASEMNCDALLKATKVDGVYDSDPATNKDAKRYDVITYREVLMEHLNVMDQAAIALAQDRSLPILVFSILEKGMLLKVVSGQGRATKVMHKG